MGVCNLAGLWSSKVNTVLTWLQVSNYFDMSKYLFPISSRHLIYCFIISLLENMLLTSIKFKWPMHTTLKMLNYDRLLYEQVSTNNEASIKVYVLPV